MHPNILPYPANLSKSTTDAGRGQHTEDILKEAGLSENEIAKLKDDGTV